MPERTLKILYISGAGRSGSTVLGALLGSHVSVFTAGELNRLTKDDSLHSRFCACGEKGDTCSYWTKVLGQWSNEIENIDIAWYRTLQSRFERIRSIPRLLRESEAFSPEFQQYCLYTRTLIQTMLDSSSSKIIVDTAKDLGRALALSLVPGLDVRIIHLIRDGRGFLWSRMRPLYKKDKADPPSMQLIRSAALNSMEWVLINLVTEIVVKMAKVPSVRIYYENFTSTPSSLSEAMRPVVADWTTDGFTVVQPGDEVKFGHMIGGNRVRMQQAVKLSYDDKWKKGLSIREQRIFWIVGGLLARRYGYTFS